MAAKRSRPGAYISIRIGQVLLCAGHLYVCSALVFFFGDNVNRSDYALGYRHKREAIPGRGGGSYSGGSGGSGGGDKGPSDPQMPAMFLLGVSAVSLLTALVSLSIMLCVRLWQGAMRFFYSMDMFLSVVWVAGVALLAKVMAEYDVFGKWRPHAVFYKATLGLSIALLSTFLVTCVYSRALQIKPDAPAATVAAAAPPAASISQGYGPVLGQAQDVKYAPRQPIQMQQQPYHSPQPPYHSPQHPLPQYCPPPPQHQQPQPFQQPFQQQPSQQPFQQPQWRQ